MSALMESIEKWCKHEADRYCCDLQRVRGEFVRRVPDAFEVTFHCFGPRGDQYSVLVIDEESLLGAGANSKQVEALVRYESRAVCELLRCVVMVPIGVPVVVLGGYCETHRGAVISRIDREHWTFGCTTENQHPLPDRVALANGSRGYTVERKPERRA